MLVPMLKTMKKDLSYDTNTLTYRINVQQSLIIFSKFSNLHGLISSYTFIYFWQKFLATLLKRVGKLNFYLVPTWLFGTTRLLHSEDFSNLHDYSILHDYSVRQSTYSRGKSLLELWVTTFLPDWQPPSIFVRLISNFLCMCSDSIASAHVILK